MKLKDLIREYHNALNVLNAQPLDVQDYTTLSYRDNKFVIEQVKGIDWKKPHDLENRGLGPIIGRRYYTTGISLGRKYTVSLSTVKRGLKALGIEIVSGRDNTFRVLSSDYPEDLLWSKLQLRHFFLMKMF